VKILVFRI